MGSYQCWFCGEGIDRSDTSAVVITLENLWRWAVLIPARDRPSQAIYSHGACAEERMKGATMEIDPGVFDESD